MSSINSLIQAGWKVESRIKNESDSSTTVTMRRPLPETSLCEQTARIATYCVTAPILGTLTVAAVTRIPPAQICWKCENECPNKLYDCVKYLFCACVVGAAASSDHNRFNRGEYVPYNQSWMAQSDGINDGEYDCYGRELPIERIGPILDYNTRWYDYLAPTEIFETTCFTTKKITCDEGDPALEQLEPIFVRESG